MDLNLLALNTVKEGFWSVIRRVYYIAFPFSSLSRTVGVITGGFPRTVSSPGSSSVINVVAHPYLIIVSKSNIYAGVKVILSRFGIYTSSAIELQSSMNLIARSNDQLGLVVLWLPFTSI